MFRIGRLLALAVLVLPAAARAEGFATDVATLGSESAFSAPLEVAPGSALESLRDRQVVFVGGYLNEAFQKNYFKDALAVTKDELGVRASTVFPASHESVTEDADKLAEEVTAKFEAPHEPVVLVGHSKGGSDALLAVMRHPELVLSGKVDRVVSIQGAIGGSPVAEELERIDPDGYLPGLASISTTGSREVFRDQLAALRRDLPPGDFERLSSRIFYVRGAVSRSSLSMELRPTHRLLDRYSPNDGLVVASDQKLDGIGTDLGVVDADHAALTVAGLLSSSTTDYRRGFMRALAGDVLAPRIPPPSAAAGRAGRGDTPGFTGVLR